MWKGINQGYLKVFFNLYMWVDMGFIDNIAWKIANYLQLQELTDREIAIEYGQRFIGTWYLWGGDDPSGFDCSGLLVEILQAVGKIPRNKDFTANSLALYGRKNGWKESSKPYRGCIVFYKNNPAGDIVHVEFMLTDKLSLGASGGGSNIYNAEEAIKHNAYIKIRPYDSRKGAWLFLDPFNRDDGNG